MELTKELNRTINCLMAHPDNEPNSEFADRIDSLIDLQEQLKILASEEKAVDENERVKKILKKFQAYHNDGDVFQEYPLMQIMDNEIEEFLKESEND